MNDINIIHEDDELILIDKPSGLVVNRSETYKGYTLQDFLDEKFFNDDTVTEWEDEFRSRSGIVHRLDKETSGVLVVAKSNKAMKFLQKQFKTRQVEKSYKAVVFGHLESKLIDINAPIGRNPKNRVKFAIVKDAREALTAVKKEKSLKLVDEKGFKQDFDLVNVFPKTGRTHQIRVHLASINSPVAGDLLYCTKRQLDISNRFFSRLMLHSEKITFIHPLSHKKVTYKADIPQEFNV